MDRFNDFKEHEAVNCSVSNCNNEADFWVDMDGMKNDTFYLCDEHMSKVSNEDMEYIHINVHDGNIEVKEIAGYACHEKCPVCNE